MGWGWGGQVRRSVASIQEVDRRTVHGRGRYATTTATHTAATMQKSPKFWSGGRKKSPSCCREFFLFVGTFALTKEFLFGKNVSIKDGMDREGGGEKHHRGKWESHQIRDGETKILLLLFSLSSHVRLFSFTFFGGKNERE